MPIEGKLHLGVDLGGTKVLVGAAAEVPVEGKQLLLQSQFATFPEGRAETAEIRDELIGKIADQIVSSIKEARSKGYDVSSKIGFGSPGLIADGRIQAGTVEQMGPAFENFKIEEALNAALAERIEGYSIIVKNDGLAQLGYGLHQVLKSGSINAETLSGKTIAYVGPGSSLGGGFAKLRTEGDGIELDFLDNDGHIFDILIDGELAHYKFSGLFFKREGLKKFGKEVTGKDVAENLNDPRFYDLAKEAGVNMGKIIEAIHLGKIHKPAQHRQWSSAEAAEVAGTDVFVIGGSIGTQGKMGKIVQREAGEYLKSRGLQHLTVLPIQGSSAEAGLVGATSFGENRYLIPDDL